MRLRIAFLLALSMLAPACASPSSGNAVAPADAVATILGAPIRLVEGDDAAEVLGRSDAFTQAMGAYERSLRSGTTGPVSEAEFLADAASGVVPWEEEARAVWTAAAQELAEALEGLSLDLPAEILVIRTQPDYDVGAPHTRGPAVILPQPSSTFAFSLLAHELFHVASRHDPSLRDRLFPLFGYRVTDPVPIPDAIATQRLTNPDAHEFRHSITVTTPDGEADVVTMLSTKLPLEEAIKVEDILSSALQLNLVTADGTIYAPEDTNFFQVAAINTGYIIHPEEVVADNFAMLCLRRAGNGPEVPKPEYLDKLEAALSAAD